MNWDEFYLGMAEYVSKKSKDPSTKCGAIIVRPDNTIASLGYNGFPRFMLDGVESYNNREEKYSKIIHAEMNAILNSREVLKYYTLYTWPLLPCDRCAVHIIQTGIIGIKSKKLTKELEERWSKSVELSKKYFKEAGVYVSEY